MAEQLHGIPALRDLTRDQVETRYDELSAAFHQHLDAPEREDLAQNAAYHRNRYIDLLSREYSGRVLDVGNDQPFLAFLLAHLNPDATFDVIAFDVPRCPVAVHALDIESEPFPFPADTFDAVLFTEVIEHLWRNPSFCIHEINRVSRMGAELFVTTPNPCERHAITCVLWQANPNGRSQYFPVLEQGHTHLWSTGDLRAILEAHGFEVYSLTTQDFYGYTKDDEQISDLIRAISPTPDLMGEAIVVRARKSMPSDGPKYPERIFPAGLPVQFRGSIAVFARSGERP